eukprot:COSAG02_NODE_11980_length_1620_cov_4.507561_3_plen_98_part_00
MAELDPVDVLGFVCLDLQLYPLATAAPPQLKPPCLADDGRPAPAKATALCSSYAGTSTLADHLLVALPFRSSRLKSALRGVVLVDTHAVLYRVRSLE